MDTNSQVYKDWWETFDSLYKDRRFDIDYEQMGIIAALLVVAERVQWVK